MNTILKLEQVSAYAPNQETGPFALDEINLSVAEGEWVAVVGPNGSGKSLLAGVMTGLLPAARGKLSLPSQDGKWIRLVLQNPEAQIIGETVMEDLCFGLEHAVADASMIAALAEEALVQVGLHSQRHRPTAELSGGQKQLLAIAGCIAAGARLIVLDEPTSMLDPASREIILQVMQKLRTEGTAIVWTTQQTDEAGWADRVIALEEGKMVYSGNVTDFFYGTEDSREAGHSPCEQLGLLAPYTIQVARRLIWSGYALESLPLLPHQLAQAVSRI